MLLQFLKTISSARGVFGPHGTPYGIIGQDFTDAEADSYASAGVAIRAVAPDVLPAPLTPAEITQLMKAGCDHDSAGPAFRKQMQSLLVDPLVAVKLDVDTPLPYAPAGKSGETVQVAQSVAKELVDAKPPKASYV